MEWSDRVKLILMRFDTVDVVYRTAGNMLELCPRVSMSQDRDGFKRAVIQSGSIIEAIQQSRSGNEAAPQVQLFPSLLDSKHIALVRTGGAGGGCGRNATSMESARDEQDVQNFLERTGSVYSLPVKMISKSGASGLGRVDLGRVRLGEVGSDYFPNSGLCNGRNQPYCQPYSQPHRVKRVQRSNGTARESSSTRYVITSFSDNPFVWIRTGYFLEKIHRFVGNGIRCKLVGDTEREHLHQTEYQNTRDERNEDREDEFYGSIPQVIFELETVLETVAVAGSSSSPSNDPQQNTPQHFTLQSRGKRAVKSTNPVS